MPIHRIALLWSASLFLLALTITASPAAAAGQSSVARPATPGRLDVRLLDLAAIRRLVNSLIRTGPTMTEGERAAAWADVSLLSQAVIGDTRIPFDLAEIERAAASGGGPRVSATPGVATRDEAAYQLLALGYSAREIADVVSGRISQRALDTARQMLAVGQSRDAAANYLDGQYRRVVALRTARSRPLRRTMTPTAFDVLIEKYAALHQVEAAVVRAIIQTESAFNPLALSRKGAIGLMQLMPMTARELGVDPFVPEQNIEGGVRYLSQLLRTFGGLELALVAYNGGPGYASRYARGQAALYGETRDYVQKVLARINALR
jgi:soluble lytic murein transglycosylase-like protein